MTIFFLECWGDASAVGSASGAGSENITFIQDDTQNSSYLVHVWSLSGPGLVLVCHCLLWKCPLYGIKTSAVKIEPFVKTRPLAAGGVTEGPDVAVVSISKCNLSFRKHGKERGTPGEVRFRWTPGVKVNVKISVWAWRCRTWNLFNVVHTF